MISTKYLITNYLDLMRKSILLNPPGSLSNSCQTSVFSFGKLFIIIFSGKVKWLKMFLLQHAPGHHSIPVRRDDASPRMTIPKKRRITSSISVKLLQNSTIPHRDYLELDHNADIIRLIKYGTYMTLQKHDANHSIHR